MNLSKPTSPQVRHIRCFFGPYYWDPGAVKTATALAGIEWPFTVTHGTIACIGAGDAVG
jgi:hypothetical protein